MANHKPGRSNKRPSRVSSTQLVPYQGPQVRDPVIPLHVCWSCSQPFMYMDQPEVKLRGDVFAVSLRCGNCGERRHGVFRRLALDQFDVVDGQWMQKINADYHAILHFNLQHDLETFQAASTADQIWPEDFAA